MKSKSLKEWITEITQWIKRPRADYIYSVILEDVDAKQSNNGITEIQYPGFSIYDKNGGIISRVESIVYPSGDICTQMYARNYNSNGTSLGQPTFRAGITKTGSTYYEVGGTMLNQMFKWQRYSQSLANQSSGGKTLTFTAPTGYTILGQAPYNCFISGAAQDYITDRAMSINTSTNVVTISYYAWIPNPTANLSAHFDILFVRKGIFT